MRVARKSIEPFKATVSFGLNKGYTDELISKEAIIREINDYQSKLANEKDIYLSISISRSEEHTSELQSRGHLVCRLLLEKKKKNRDQEAVQKNKHTPMRQ